MEKIIEKRGDMMILKDIEGFVPSWKTRKDKPELYNEGFDDGVLFIMDELDKCPTVDAVTVADLIRLRDHIYQEDEISLSGLRKLNMLIRKYEVSE